jgi:hypothetical protein
MAILGGRAEGETPPASPCHLESCRWAPVVTTMPNRMCDAFAPVGLRSVLLRFDGSDVHVAPSSFTGTLGGPDYLSRSR